MKRSASIQTSDLGLIAIAVVMGIAVFLVGTAETASLIAERRLLTLHGTDAFSNALFHLTNPAQGLDPRSSVSGALYWVVTCVSAAPVLVAVLRLRMHLHLGSTRHDGIASRDAVLEVIGRRAPHHKAAQQGADDAGVNRLNAIDLGTNYMTGDPLIAMAEDSYLVIGPPRCGKTSSLLVPNIVSWDGAAVVTSTKPELFQMTAHLRPGRVVAFDPTHFIAGAPRAGWSPVAGCEDPLVAILRAKAFVGASASGKGVTNGEYWAGSAVTILRCLFHAAAISGGTIADVIDWVADPESREPGEILAGSRDVPGWMSEWKGITSTSAKERGSMYNSARRALDAFADPRVVATCCPGPHDNIDLNQVIDERMTVYIAADSRTQDAIAPIVSAFIESLVDVARKRTKPQLGLFLDEASQIAPIPTLPNVVSDGGGSGITTIVVLQSLSQARARWGEHNANVIWNASTAKVIFGGIAEDDDLERISRLCGEVDEQTRSVSRGAGGGSSETLSTRKRRVFEAATIRQLPEGEALLLYRRMRPIHLRLAPWWKRPIKNAVRPAGSTVADDRRN